MTQIRTINRVVPAARQLEGAGFEVRRPFPRPELPLVDPFLLLDHMGPNDFGPGEAKGAPDHPHRGFETVTYMLEGSVEHEDSAGHRGRIGPGAVQWMTAGSGVIHSELPGAELLTDGGRMHGVQLWVNLPAAEKMIAPRYQEFSANEIPKVQLAGGGVARVIAGEVSGTRGAVETRTPVTYLHVTLPPGTRFTHTAPAGHHAMTYGISGEGEGELTLFADDGDTVEIEASADAPEPREVLMLAGEPLREPVVRYGPFVMSTKAELAQAVDDYQAGRFGAITR